MSAFGKGTTVVAGWRPATIMEHDAKRCLDQRTSKDHQKRCRRQGTLIFQARIGFNPILFALDLVARPGQLSDTLASMSTANQPRGAWPPMAG